MIDEIAEWKEQLFQISRLKPDKLVLALEQIGPNISEEIVFDSQSARSNMFEPSEKSFRTYGIKVPEYYKVPLPVE